MIIKRSSKYNPKGEFWNNGLRVHISRVFGGIAFHGLNKFAVLLGEQRFYNETHYFVLCEAETGTGESIYDIINACRKMNAEYKNERFFGRLDENIKQTLAVCNKQLYNAGYRNVVVSDVPRIGEYIDEQVSMIDMLVKQHEKRLHFFAESMIVSELKSLPSRDIRAEDFPRTTAIANVIAGMLKFSGDPVLIDVNPDPEPMF